MTIWVKKDILLVTFEFMKNLLLETFWVYEDAIICDYMGDYIVLNSSFSYICIQFEFLETISMVTILSSEKHFFGSV